MPDPNVWPVVADVVMPAAAVLISAGVAILLARLERKAAARDRDDERARAEREREREREQVESDRVRMKTEATFEQVVGTLSWFVTAHPGWEEWQPQMRLLRGQAKVAQAVPASDAQDFAFWFAGEVQRGLREGGRAIAQYIEVSDRLTDEHMDAAVEQIMSPFRLWANLTIDLVVIWLRESTPLSEIKQVADGAAKLRWDQGRIDDQEARNSGGVDLSHPSTI